MTKSSGIFVCVLSVVLAGCTGTIGRPKVLNQTAELVVPKHAKTTADSSELLPVESRTGGHSRVGADYQPREGMEEKLVNSFRTIARADKPTVSQLHNFVEQSYGAIHFGCAAYLGGKSNRQREINVARDLFPPLTALIAGTAELASSNGSVDEDLLTGLALYSTAATAGFEVYEQRFLFGSKNVDAVRELINAKLESEKEAAKLKIAANPTFTETMVRVDLLQTECWPAKITETVREAIEAGTIELAPSAQQRRERENAMKLLAFLVDSETLTADQVEAARTAMLKGEEPKKSENVEEPAADNMTSDDGTTTEGAGE